MKEELLDAIVIGAGPAGLSCAVGLERGGYRYAVLDKGGVVETIYRMPTHMVFFTTPELLEIGGIPMVCSGPKPTRAEALMYYRRVVENLSLRIHPYEQVESVTGQDGDFRVDAVRSPGEERRRYRSRKLVVATGIYDNPNRLGIPGEELPKVSHYYAEAHPYHGCDVAVIGGANSAAEAALELFRAGARVTLIHRGGALAEGLKYWVAPDIANRIRNGQVHAQFGTVVTAIEPDRIRLRRLADGAESALRNDFVLALIGYHADEDFLKQLGVELHPETRKPRLDPATLESNVPGLYLAGVVIAGVENNKVFIENGRFHGERIVSALGKALPRSAGTPEAIGARRP
jgi:bacillithiol disulfide reductase